MTPRELEVIVAIALMGGSYSEVANLFGIKVQTVKNHAASVRAKYGARSNTELWAKLGWLTVPYDPPWYEYRSTY